MVTNRLTIIPKNRIIVVPEGITMRIAAYFRVSTKAQGEGDRLGLPAQEAAVDRFCEQNGHEIVGRYADVGFSGATADRPELARVLADASLAKFDAVVVYRGDRLARDTMLDGYLRYMLKRHGVAVLSASEGDSAGEDPVARLTQSVLAAVAEFERHLIRQRLSAARRVKKASGGYADGRPRFGFRAENASLVAIEREQAAIALMRRLRRRGESFRSIATALDSVGYLPRRGSTWHPFSVRRILARKTPKPKSVQQGFGTAAWEC
jgi:DNA invertase Pin-like site-specific DNA recombinase